MLAQCRLLPCVKLRVKSIIWCTGNSSVCMVSQSEVCRSEFQIVLNYDIFDSETKTYLEETVRCISPEQTTALPEWYLLILIHFLKVHLEELRSSIRLLWYGKRFPVSMRKANTVYNFKIRFKTIFSLPVQHNCTFGFSS